MIAGDDPAWESRHTFLLIISLSSASGYLCLLWDSVSLHVSYNGLWMIFMHARNTKNKPWPISVRLDFTNQSLLCGFCFSQGSTFIRKLITDRRVLTYTHVQTAEMDSRRKRHKHIVDMSRLWQHRTRQSKAAFSSSALLFRAATTMTQLLQRPDATWSGKAPCWEAA